MEIKTRFNLGQELYRIDLKGNIVPFKLHAITVEKDKIAYHDRQGHFLMEDDIYGSEQEASIILERDGWKYGNKTNN